MSLLDRFQSGYASVREALVKSPDRKTGGDLVVDKLERWGGITAFGYLKGHATTTADGKGYAYLGPVPVDAALGGLFSAVAGWMYLTNKDSKLAPHLERLGDAGMMSFLDSMGAAWGSGKWSPITTVLGSGETPALPGSVVGSLPAAVGGAYLTPDEIARYSSPR